jgi:hypothetical protein
MRSKIIKSTPQTLGGAGSLLCRLECSDRHVRRDARPGFARRPEDLRPLPKGEPGGRSCLLCRCLQDARPNP